MRRLDHLTIPVMDLPRSRDWYIGTLGLKAQDLLGLRAELKDPDGYLVRLWDQRSMKEK